MVMLWRPVLSKGFVWDHVADYRLEAPARKENAQPPVKR